MTTTEAALGNDPVTRQRKRSSAAGLTATFGLFVLLLVIVGACHIVQGSAQVGTSDLITWLTRTSGDQTTAVIVESRLPRVAAGIVVGIALGVAGAVMQSVSHNILASPDTLAVNAGASVALACVAAFGVSLPLFGSTGVAFAGGLGAAAFVLLLTGTEYGTVRLVLGGSAVMLALIAVTRSLYIVFPFEAGPLHAWSSGTLGQKGFGNVVVIGVAVLVTVAVMLGHSRRLDLLILGDDEARSLGVPVRRTQLVVLLLAVLLSSLAVTLTGPIGFLGLAAPAIARLMSKRIAGLHRHRALIPISALAGAILVLLADVVLRALIGAQQAGEIPTGIITSLVGACFLIGLAYRLRPTTVRPVASLDVRGAGIHRRRLVVGAMIGVLGGVIVAGFLLGDTTILFGDLVNWATGRSGPLVSTLMDSRAPRVCAAALAGICLAVAGTLIQGVARNPLADPTIIGVAGGASVGAVVVVTFVPLASFWVLTGAAGAGAVVTAILLFGLAARGGFATDRLVLIGIGISAAASAMVTLLIVATDPWNASKALTWLSGSTYGRTFEHLVPMMVASILLLPFAFSRCRELDLLSVDEDTPRVLGIDVPRSRLLLLGTAVLLTAVAVAGIGVIGFVGLVAPHAARILVGRRHSRALPVAALLGAILVVVGDIIGRTAMAPTQLPAGLMTAIVGAPYFFWLLHRSRRPE